MKRLLSLALVLLLLTLTACGTSYQSKADYFNGEVLVEYFQTSQYQDDNVTFTFYDHGEYQVSFSYTEGRDTFGSSPLSGKAELPPNFDFTVQDNPRTKVISQYILPGFLTVTITHDGQTESHDFE